MDERHGLEEQWREWSKKEPALDERQLKRNLLERIPGPRSKKSTRLVMVAAAASLVALLIGYEPTRQPVMPPVVDAPEIVHETGPNVILVLLENAEPIYVLTGPSDRNTGE